MGFSLYLVFRNNMLRSTRGKRLINLCLIFLVYLFAGSYVFYTMNRPLELSAMREWREYRANWTEQHACLLLRDNTTGRDLDEFIELILRAADSGVVFAKNSSDFTQNWSFGGETIFFAFTLLATIGYGHAVPLTDAGKLFSIVYIVFGVPLSMLFMSLIVQQFELALLKNTKSSSSSSRLSNGKRYEQVANGGEQPRFKKYSSVGDLNEAEQNQLINNPASSSSERKERSIMRSVYTRTFLVGLVLVMGVYVGPALLFANYTEASWSVSDALYYCFVSITTIGFG
jgi:hypothetical protein